MGRRPAQYKVVSDTELEFYKDELKKASEASDHLQIAQTWRNIKDFTGWPVQKIASEFHTYAGAITPFLKVLALPETLLAEWAAERMSTTVALRFTKIEPPELRESVFDEMKLHGLSFKCLTVRSEEIIEQALNQGKNLGARPAITPQPVEQPSQNGSTGAEPKLERRQNAPSVSSEAADEIATILADINMKALSLKGFTARAIEDAVANPIDALRLRNMTVMANNSLTYFEELLNLAHRR